MDMLKYLRIRNRLCDYHQGNCPECEFAGWYGVQQACEAVARKDPKKAVEIVERWGKAHPGRTRQDDFLKLFPHAKADIDGNLDIAPCAIEGKTCPEMGSGGLTCRECRQKYWSEEVEL